MKKILFFIGLFLLGVNVSFANQVTINNLSGEPIYEYEGEDDLSVAEVITLAVFEGTSFKGANLEGVDFEGTDLKNTSFENANLKNADLENINFENVNFKGSNLENANLRTADIKGVTSFENANLKNSDWTLVYLTKGSNFQNANIEGAIEIEEAMLSDPNGANMNKNDSPTETQIENNEIQEEITTDLNSAGPVPTITKLPTTGPEHIILIILSLGIAFFINRKKAIK